MKYCSNCGGQIPENMNFCPNCGTAIMPEEQQTNTQTPTENINTQSNNTQRPTIKNRSIGLCIVLSIITCGIYGIYWYICLVNDVNSVCQDEKSSQSGGVVFLLTLITCGIYGIYWFYTAGKRMNAAGNKYNMAISDNSIMYLILSLVGLSIINYCIVQSDLNKFA